METVDQIFDRYEAIRHRLPNVKSAGCTQEINSLLEIADQADVFVFDAFGVLNVGETPIPGAADRLEQLRERGCQIRILSNAASYDHDRAVAKFQKLGMNVSPEEITTSRDAALSQLEPGLWGCIAAPSDDLGDIPADVLRLGDELADYNLVDGFIFLSTEVWTKTRQAHLELSLRTNPRPVVIANTDLAAPREGGFSLEPGHFGHLMEDQGTEGIRYFGKPFLSVYEILETSLAGIDPKRIVMCGDTLHTDIVGAAARGWRTVLVTKDGMFAGKNPLHFCQRADIIPDWHLARI